MTPALYLAYVLATLAFCITPGPAVLLVASQSAARGFGAGMQAICGIILAEVVYWSVSAAGLTAVLIGSETVFTIVKYAGAAYLILLGVMTIRGARAHAEKMSASGPTALWRSPFLQGIVGHFANPKAVLFFIALLPQFMIPGQTTLADLGLLAITGMALDFLILAGYGWLAARSKALLRDPMKLMWRERLAGAAQIAVGGMIAVMRRGTI